MPPPQSAEEHYSAIQRIQLGLLIVGRRLWARMGPDFDASWRQVAGPLATVTAAAQAAAARAATTYVPAVLEETGQPNEPLAAVRPEAFAGVASDGRSLVGLLAGAPRLAKVASGRGMAPDRALAFGGRWLDGTLQTIATDAARDAAQAEVIVRRNMGYVRMVNPPCCSRCAVMAGAWVSRSDIMPRHKRCDCTLIPCTENRAGDFTTSPQTLVDRGLVTDLSRAQRARIDEGQNLSRVLNESRDRWRERLAAERRATKGKRSMWAETAETPPLGTALPDVMARLTASVDAQRAARLLREAGIAN